MSKPLNAYTDYPHGSLREVVVVDYDHNKYVTLSNGESIKSGYVYRNRRQVCFRYDTLVRRFPIEYPE